MINKKSNQIKKHGYEVIIENNKIYTQNPDWTNNTEFEKTITGIVNQYNHGDESKISINKTTDSTGIRLMEINMDPVRKVNIFGGVYYA